MRYEFTLPTEADNPAMYDPELDLRVDALKYNLPSDPQARSEMYLHRGLEQLRTDAADILDRVIRHDGEPSIGTDPDNPRLLQEEMDRLLGRESTTQTAMMFVGAVGPHKDPSMIFVSRGATDAGESYLMVQEQYEPTGKSRRDRRFYDRNGGWQIMFMDNGTVDVRHFRHGADDTEQAARDGSAAGVEIFDEEVMDKLVMADAGMADAVMIENVHAHVRNLMTRLELSLPISLAERQDLEVQCFKYVMYEGNRVATARPLPLIEGGRFLAVMERREERWQELGEPSITVPELANAGLVDPELEAQLSRVRIEHSNDMMEAGVVVNRSPLSPSGVMRRISDAIVNRRLK